MELHKPFFSSSYNTRSVWMSIRLVDGRLI
jgi:hypothetical protein